MRTRQKHKKVSAARAKGGPPQKPRKIVSEPTRSTNNTLLSSLLLLALLVIVAVANTGPIASNDYGMHLRLGQDIAETGRPPRVDNHSYTLPDAPYQDSEWLSQLVLYGLQRLVGDGGMVLLKGLLIGLAFASVAASVRGPVVLKLAIVLVLMVLGFDRSYMRPYLISWVMAAALNLLLERKLKWAVVVLLVVWANSHGSLLLGVGIAGLYFLEEYWQTRQKSWLLWAAACGLVPLLNPNGIGIYSVFFKITEHADFVGEWKPYAPEAVGFWLVVAVAGLSVFGLSKRRPFNGFDLIRVVVLTFMGFQASRGGVVMVIYLAPLLGRWYAPVVSQWSIRLRQVVAVCLLVGMLVAIGLRVQAGKALHFELDHQHLPVAAVEFIMRHQLDGPMFNDYNFGGYLMWKAWPEHPVFVDGRIEVYQGRVLEEYLTVSKAQPGWEGIVEGYGIAFFVMRPERELAHLLLNHQSWDLVYFDYHSTIFVRHDLFPELKRLHIVSPYGHRDRTKVAQAIEEISYLLEENPLFFGGYKILAFLLYRRGDYEAARDALKRYLELHPQGIRVKETKSLIQGLSTKGAWP